MLFQVYGYYMHVKGFRVLRPRVLPVLALVWVDTVSQHFGVLLWGYCQ